MRSPEVASQWQDRDDAIEVTSKKSSASAPRRNFFVLPSGGLPRRTARAGRQTNLIHPWCTDG